MRKINFIVMFLALFASGLQFASADDGTCFESRKGASGVTRRMSADGVPNVKCSPKTGAVLWWGDPYDGTVAMVSKPVEGDYSRGTAVVKPRSPKVGLLPYCGATCHNGVIPPEAPKDKNPRLLYMHKDIVLDATQLAHGRGGIWCLDCHHPTQRNRLIDNFGNPVSFDEPPSRGSVIKEWACANAGAAAMLPSAVVWPRNDLLEISIFCSNRFTGL